MDHSPSAMALSTVRSIGPNSFFPWTDKAGQSQVFFDEFQATKRSGFFCVPHGQTLQQRRWP
jgi:hypothetical protein